MSDEQHDKWLERLTRNEVETHGAQRKEVKRRVIVLQHLDVLALALALALDCNEQWDRWRGKGVSVRFKAPYEGENTKQRNNWSDAHCRAFASTRCQILTCDLRTYYNIGRLSSPVFRFRLWDVTLLKCVFLGTRAGVFANKKLHPNNKQ
jgi:hypothetical protein